MSQVQAFPEGMTLRDYFAAKAMQTMCGSVNIERFCKLSYEIADAMLKERDL